MLTKSVNVITPPALEPISLEDMKHHMRVSTDADDAYITSLIVAARLDAEVRTGKSFITQTLKLSLDSFPAGVIYIPKSPVQSIDSITYIDSNGDTQTWNSLLYVLDNLHSPPRLAPAANQDYPSIRGDDLSGVNITYVAGYGSAASDVPMPLIQAMKLIAAHWYEGREAVSTFTLHEVPFAYKALLSTYCIRDVQ